MEGERHICLLIGIAVVGVVFQTASLDLQSLVLLCGLHLESLHTRSTTLATRAEFLFEPMAILCLIALRSLLEVGAIRKWEGPGPITVINGLSVIMNRRGKMRLILDARYINLCDKYTFFSYEKR